MTITIDTLEVAHRYGYTLGGFCRRCGRGAFLDVPALIAAGRGAQLLRRLRVRCTTCGSQGEISVISRGESLP